MTDAANPLPYAYFADLAAEVQIPEKGILSRTLFQDEKLRVVLFAFASGEELSAHTAPVPAILYFLKGKARLKLGTDEMEAGPGTLAHMQPGLAHAITADGPVIMLLTMLKKSKE